jgi:hypothetical protein
MFLQQSTPDTSGYMIAGYVIAFLVMGLYAASIYLRNRNLKQDVTLLEEMEKNNQAKTGPRSGKPPKTVTKKGRKK